jgi:hypothetical protein
MLRGWRGKKNRAAGRDQREKKSKKGGTVCVLDSRVLILDSFVCVVYTGSLAKNF